LEDASETLAIELVDVTFEAEPPVILLTLWASPAHIPPPPETLDEVPETLTVVTLLDPVVTFDAVPETLLALDPESLLALPPDTLLALPPETALE
jgi:hypothetical protein